MSSIGQSRTKTCGWKADVHFIILDAQNKKAPATHRRGLESISILKKLDYTRFFNRSEFSTAGRPIG
jgi:hypothetical protein